MGGVVLGAASIATVSMAVALAAVFGTWASPAVLGFALLWGLFILNLDRWLMSTVIDRDGPARIVRFLPRILLAVVFGVIIAEPLLLGIFSSAIERHVRDGRSGDIGQYEAALVRCNPMPWTNTAPDAGCTTGGYLIAAEPPPSQAALEQAGRQAGDLGAQLAQEKQQYQRELDEAQAECAGVAGPGLTGRPGMGPACTRRYADLNESQSRLADGETRLRGLEESVRSLTATVATEREAYTAWINGQIATRVAHRRGSEQIGLLERLRAMQELVSVNGYMHATQWALRIFFIVADSLPVLIKMLSGRTAHDRIALGHVARQERAAQLNDDTLTYQDTVRAGVRRYEIELSGTAERNRASVHAWWNARGTDEELLRLVDEETQQIMDQAALIERESSRHKPIP
jgi:hypothetical protein